MTTRHILALDCGRSTGWARSDGAFGTLDLRRDDDAVAFADFEVWLSDQFRAHFPRLLLVERAFMGRMHEADFAPCLIRVAHMVAYRFGTPRRELTADQVRRSVFGRARGTSDSERIAWAHREHWMVATDHEADAVALLTAHMLAQPRAA